MNILMVHPSFPGQYLYLAGYLGKQPGNKVIFLAENNAIGVTLEGVQLALYKEPRESSKEIHHYLKPAEEAVLKGQQTVRALDELRRGGFTPDIIIGHAGWGNLMYTKDIFPDVPVIGYFEWFYHALASDSFYWKGEEADIDTSLAIRTKNMHHLLSLDTCDAGITPTRWQYDQFPEIYRPMLNIIHEGIDTEFCSPLPNSQKPALTIKGEDENILELPEGTEYISYVSRGFEEIRGFPEFMEAIRIVLKERPNCHVVLAGSDRICYGSKIAGGKTYKQLEEEKGGYDEKRVHFVGNLNRGEYQKLLRSSYCHVYLTRPFVLSWSMLEAMSFGLPLVSSLTPPVQEVVEDGKNGLLAEYRNPSHIARRIMEILDDRELAKRLGKAARETILERYELNKCLKAQEDLIYKIVEEKAAERAIRK